MKPLFAAMLFAATACATAPPTPRGDGAFLTVHGDAGVYVDGARLGTSPLERVSIAPGHHVVEAALEGFEAQTVEVTVPAEHEAIVTFALVRKTPSVANANGCAFLAPLAPIAIFQLIPAMIGTL